VTTLLLLIALVAISALVHEAGHAAVGALCGWKIVGVRVHPLGGIGIAMKQNDPADLWKVAAGGLAASGLLALGFAALGGVWGTVGFTLNAVLLLVNAVPLGPTDGAHILRAWRA